ncbi:sedoheptulokinase [Planctomicrobium sp. SH668]|uniref:sedoheptulokinase n=1 Tax=Planctomicrobium sp. SH668 TaxID=3448126 RepID=UPI003F5BC9E6
MKVLGIDVGSSSIKGAVLDLDQRSVQCLEREPFPAPLNGLPSGYFEVDPHAILSAAMKVIDRLLLSAPDCSGLFFSGQKGGTILVDDAGNPLTNYLSWRDQRSLDSPVSSESTLQSIRSKWCPKLYAEIGNELHPGSTTTLLVCLKQQGKLPSNGIPASVADFVISSLCKTPPQMDVTHTIGMLNLSRGEIHHEAMQAIGLTSINWPAISDIRTPVGTATLKGRKIPCFASFGDQQCALKGAGLQLGELSLNISTGSQVSLLSHQFELGTSQCSRYFDGLFLNTFTHLPAGRSLNVLVDLLLEIPKAQGLSVSNPWEYIAREVASATGGGLQTKLSFFAGPLGNSGHIDGITTENLTVGNLFHACLESMADNLLAASKQLGYQSQWKRLAISGGMTRSVPLLREMIQSRFGCEIRESIETEETLAGLLEIARGVMR